MALRHAVLAALLDGEATGYELAKRFDVSVASFWHALPQQLYGELKRLEEQSMAESRTVPQTGRPDKRIFTITAKGHEELRAFALGTSRPTSVKDDLLVKVQAADHVDLGALIDEIERYAETTRSRLATYEQLAAAMRGERTEAEYLARADRIGPYLTLARGRSFERENLAWCDRALPALSARRDRATATTTTDRGA